jgi:4-amino-4-deoxy-L-arabinose transferase-like glycosyltransferase
VRLPSASSPGAAARGAALVAILLLAAGLRFWRLDWGLRHRPDQDERVFVENAAVMAAHGSLDHRFYQYPALVFDLLAPLLRLRGTEAEPDPGAYLWARGLVAAFGVASVALVYVLGRRWIGTAGALAAALFLAVSPVEVFVAHMVRPDVILGTFALLTLLALSSLGAGADVRAGLALGAANAVKFSGVLLLPSVFVAWLLSPRRRLSSLALIALVAAAIFFALTPYAILRLHDFLAGADVQFSYHYKRDMPFLTMVRVYLAVLPKSLGLPPVLLALLALPLLRRDWRRWAPALVFPLVSILVFASSSVRRERFLLPCLGVAALLAGRAVQAVASRHRAAAVVLALVAAAPPCADSLVYLRNLSRPLTLDRVADWVLSQVPAGATLLTFVPELGLDPERHEVLRWRGSPELAGALVRQVDYVVVDERSELHVLGLEPAFRAAPASREEGPLLAVYRVPEALRPRYRPLTAVHIAASESGDTVDLARDGRTDTAWTTAAPQHPGQWIEATWQAPARVARVVLDAGPRFQRRGESIALLVTVDGRTFSPASTVPAPVGLDHPGRQGFLIAPACLRGVRVVQEGAIDRRWAVAELLLDVLEDPGGGPSPGDGVACSDRPAGADAGRGRK